jgi:hypothetical protein
MCAKGDTKEKAKLSKTKSEAKGKIYYQENNSKKKKNNWQHTPLLLYFNLKIFKVTYGL